MFFLGQSTTYLPYLILAITYFAGLAGYSMGVFQKVDFSKAEEKVIEYKEASTHSANSSTFNYNEFNSQETYFLKESVTIDPIRFDITQKQRYFLSLSNCFIVKSEYLSDLFFRPPPTV